MTSRTARSSRLGPRSGAETTAPAFTASPIVRVSSSYVTSPSQSTSSSAPKYATSPGLASGTSARMKSLASAWSSVFVPSRSNDANTSASRARRDFRYASRPATKRFSCERSERTNAPSRSSPRNRGHPPSAADASGRAYTLPLCRSSMSASPPKTISSRYHSRGDPRRGGLAWFLFRVLFGEGAASDEVRVVVRGAPALDRLALAEEDGRSGIPGESVFFPRGLPDAAAGVFRSTSLLAARSWSSRSSRSSGMGTTTTRRSLRPLRRSLNPSEPRPLTSTERSPARSCFASSGVALGLSCATISLSSSTSSRPDPSVSTASKTCLASTSFARMNAWSAASAGGTSSSLCATTARPASRASRIESTKASNVSRSASVSPIDPRDERVPSPSPGSVPSPSMVAKYRSCDGVTPGTTSSSRALSSAALSAPSPSTSYERNTSARRFLRTRKN